MRHLTALFSLPLLGATLLLAGSPSMGHAQQDMRSTVGVVGEGRVTVQPDIANVALGVEGTAGTIAEGQADVSNRMQAILGVLDANGVSRDDVRTSRLGVAPIYDQRDASQLRGYRVSNSVQAKIRDLNVVGPIVEGATAAGANRVDGISFGLADPSTSKDQARAQAMADARQKAEQLAGIAGMRIVGVKSIAEADPAAAPVPAARQAAAPMAAGAPPPIEPGTQEVRTQVSVTYIIE